jgi:uncharacterized protein
MSNIETLRTILATSKAIAVVGLSADWFRPSYFAAKYMQDHGYRIVPVNPKYDSILGQRCYASLTEAARHTDQPIDMVDCFRNAADIEPIAREAIAIGSSCLWQQLGVSNQAAEDLVIKAGLHSIMNRCVKIEHARLFGGLNWLGVNTGVISAKRPRHLPY